MLFLMCATVVVVFIGDDDDGDVGVVGSPSLKNTSDVCPLQCCAPAAMSSTKNSVLPQQKNSPLTLTRDTDGCKTDQNTPGPDRIHRTIPMKHPQDSVSGHRQPLAANVCNTLVTRVPFVVYRYSSSIFLDQLLRKAIFCAFFFSSLVFKTCDTCMHSILLKGKIMTPTASAVDLVREAASGRWSKKRTQAKGYYFHF